MTLNKMINQTFEQQTLEAWKQKAEESLKGKTVDSLSKNTYEDIRLKPLYSKEDYIDSSQSQFPGQADYRRGSDSLGYLSEEWKVAQKINAENPEQLREKLLTALDRGQTAISIHTDNIDPSDFEKVIDGLHTKYPFSIDAKNHQADYLAKLSKQTDSDKITGYIAMDPVASFAVNGTKPQLDEIYDNWASVIQSADQNMPNLKTILIDTSVYHNAGANAVQELASALSTGVYHIQSLTDRGISLETILRKMVFKFSIGANFFMEIAKLRAARLLWSKITEAYGIKPEEQQMVISAETSIFTKSAYDPYVNMLRAGNEAFAAVLGGIQYLHVSPFNEPEGNGTPFSERVARNTQLILKEEAHLKNIIDPAGGSWYVESLTNELAEKAWSLFLQMEEKEGMAEVLQSGWLQDEIAAVLDKRNTDLFTRKQSMIGTNIYANLAEQPLQNTSHENKQGIPQVRLTEPFERLRRTASEMEQAGNQPMAGLICLGELKEHKPRADFMTGFLAPGGIHTVKSPSVATPEEALTFVEETNLKFYVICGTNKQYDQSTIQMLQLLKDKHPNKKLFLAGLPEESKQDEFKQAGIEQFIHVKSNCYEILASLLNEMEVAINE